MLHVCMLIVYVFLALLIVLYVSAVVVEVVTTMAGAVDTIRRS